MCSKACATRQDFSDKSTASALVSGDVLAMEAIYIHLYIAVTLGVLEVKLKKTLTTISEASLEICVPQYKSVINQK